MLNPTDQTRLLEIARQSIQQGFDRGAPMSVIEDLSAALCEIRSSFVTLEQDGKLRGCTGSLEATTQLAQSVSNSAYNSAFGDTRFAPLERGELPRTQIKISVLSSPEAFGVASESDLISKLRPGIDGLILRFEKHRATFLPSVWDLLDSPDEFVTQLKKKARLAEDFWSDDIIVERYGTESFGD